MGPWPPQARELASKSKVARLATVDGGGQPHAVPICFVVVDERLYTIVDQKPKRNPGNLKRLRNISANPRVAVIIDHYEDDWANLSYLMIRGSASTVTATGEFAEALPAYRDLMLDAGRRLWVEEYVPSWEERSPTWTIFAADGAMLAKTTIPENFTPHHIAEDHIVGVWLDELDVSYVHVRQILPAEVP